MNKIIIKHLINLFIMIKYGCKNIKFACDIYLFFKIKLLLKFYSNKQKLIIRTLIFIKFYKISISYTL